MASVDILINNAGLALGVASAIENELGNIQTMLATNVTAVMCLVATFGPEMRRRGKGHIVNISSVAGDDFSKIVTNQRPCCFIEFHTPKIFSKYISKSK